MIIPNIWPTSYSPLVDHFKPKDKSTTAFARRVQVHREFDVIGAVVPKHQGETDRQK